MVDDGGSKEILKQYFIPDYILVPGAEKDSIPYIPACPVIVFINSKSGGQLGKELMVTYRAILNKNQVVDLEENAPEMVLQQLFSSLETLKYSGDILAGEIQKRLRIVVAGGDGTASWLLGVICGLKLPHPPPVATVPLGTGNNLPYSFGWGKKNPGTDRRSVEAFLDRVKSAKELKIDSWHIVMKAATNIVCDPIAPLQLPHSLHAFKHASQADMHDMDGYCTFHGGFWNYFSMGMDAQVSYDFHSQRKLHPERFRNQLANQKTYLKLGCQQGWFCAPLIHPSSHNIGQLTKVSVMKKSGSWEDLQLPHSIRSIVCLNLPSFSGGLNPWGTPGGKKSKERDLTPPYVDDGLLEVVGLRDGWHGLVLFSPNGHGTRLAQARKVLFQFHKGAATHTYMRLDGEPWKQPLPSAKDTLCIEISHSGQVSMLATPHCRVKTINHSSSIQLNKFYNDG